MKNVLTKAALVGFLTFTIFQSASAKEAELVSVGDHKLEVLIQGEGDQTVIFESGLGYGLSAWASVVDEISSFATVVTYSRAGNGQSDSSDQPRTLSQIATELNSLLTAKNISPPYILVGHSAGGFYIRKYAELYPEKVRGFVFVDPTPEGILVELRGLDEEKALSDEIVINSMTPDRVKPEDIYFSAITQSGEYPKTSDLPDVPAVLITAMKQEYPQFLMHSAGGKVIWKDLQAEFITQFSDYLHVVSGASGHNVHREQPELVVDAIQHVIRQSSEPVTE